VPHLDLCNPGDPNGRYLLAVGRDLALIMLDSDGRQSMLCMTRRIRVSATVCPVQCGVPMAASSMSTWPTAQVRYSMTGRAFLVTWSDRNNDWHGSGWSVSGRVCGRLED